VKIEKGGRELYALNKRVLIWDREQAGDGEGE